MGEIIIIMIMSMIKKKREEKRREEKRRVEKRRKSEYENENEQVRSCHVSASVRVCV